VEKTSISQKLLEMALFEPNRESVTRVHPEHKTFSSPIPPTGVLPRTPFGEGLSSVRPRGIAALWNPEYVTARFCSDKQAIAANKTLRLRVSMSPPME